MIGIFGGTFDPIHNGHIGLALGLFEIHHLDEVWFCPARQNPFKKDGTAADFAHRIKMLELALADIPYFKITDLESRRPGPSYSIDTLRKIVNDQKGKQFRLILGGDAVRGFDRWKNYDEIVELAPPIIGLRNREDPFKDLQGDLKVIQKLKDGVTHMPILEISSTIVRKRIKENLYINHLVPPKVVDYIYQNKLYL